jgi:phospholipid-translocating ATPase
MTFKKCSIRGRFYGDSLYDNPAGSQGVKLPEQDSDFVWYDRTLINAIEKNEDEYIEHFFHLLALCHTVMTEEKNGKIIYQAQSPDENALVSAARSFGFAFLVNKSMNYY